MGSGSDSDRGAPKTLDAHRRVVVPPGLPIFRSRFCPVIGGCQGCHAFRPWLCRPTPAQQPSGPVAPHIGRWGRGRGLRGTRGYGPAPVTGSGHDLHVSQPELRRESSPPKESSSAGTRPGRVYQLALSRIRHNESTRRLVCAGWACTSSGRPERPIVGGLGGK